MKLNRRSNRERFPRASDALVREKVEQVTFNPETDLSSEVKEAIENTMLANATNHSWHEYTSYFSNFQVLFPEKARPAAIPVREIQSVIDSWVNSATPRFDMVFWFLTNLHLAGIDIKPFEGFKEKVLTQFAQDFQYKSNDTLLARNALDLIRLGWASVDTIFPDRDTAWKKVQQELEWRKDGDDLDIYSQLVVEARILFPDKADQLTLTPRELSRMKQEIQTIPPEAPKKALDYGTALFFLTQGELSVDRQGRIKAAPRTSLGQGVGLPPRTVLD